jgi:hypothetical protein
MSTPDLRQRSIELATHSISAIHETDQPTVKHDSSDGNDSFYLSPTALKPAATRQWGSLQEHANHVRRLSGQFSARPDDRREGVAWGDEEEEAPQDLDNQRRASLRWPKGAAQGVGSDTQRVKNNLFASDSAETFNGPQRTYSGHMKDEGVRCDTTRSSVSSIGRGGKRAVPDMRMFDPASPDDESKDELGTIGNREDPRWPSRVGRRLSFALPQGAKRINLSEKPLKLPPIAPEKPKRILKPEQSKQKGLKDRRKLDNPDFMKLSLSELPTLPPRQRSSNTVIYQPLGIGPPRPRSPKTPWIRSAWLIDTVTPTTAPARIEAVPKDDDSVFGPGFLTGNDPIISSLSPANAAHIRPRPSRRNRMEISGTSDSSIAQDGATSPSIQPFAVSPQELKELGKRSRRWRWSGHSTSNDANSADLSFPRIFRSKHPALQSNSQPVRPYTPPITVTEAPSLPDLKGTVARKRKYSPLRISRSPKNMIPDIHTPPIFVPPGVNRVPTPPIADEVKGKLADFFFEFPGQSQKRPPLLNTRSSPLLGVGVWNSDALLMSVSKNITPQTSDSDSPNAISPLPFSTDYVPPSPVGYLALTPPLHPHSQLFPLPSPLPAPKPIAPNWFRVQLSEDLTDTKLELEQRAKLKWLTPEHLPSSPLCPLHAKYTGPNPGLCVFHKRRKGSKGKVGRESEEDMSALARTEVIALAHARTRRVASLSSP